MTEFIHTTSSFAQHFVYCDVKMFGPFVCRLSVNCWKNSLNGPVLLELTLTCPRPVIYTINWRNVLQTFMRWTQEWVETLLLVFQIHITANMFNSLFLFLCVLHRPEASDKDVVTLLEILHSASGLKSVHLQVEMLSDTLVQTILSLIQTCPSLSQLG